MSRHWVIKPPKTIEPTGSGPGYRHPHVVIQNNLFNRSRINTVVVCVLTSNLRRAEAPGNVLLEEGEGNLPKQSVVNVSQRRMRHVLAGVMLVLEPRDID